MDRQGGWMQTYTGKAFYPLDPRPDEVCIDDIAHALSQIPRFGGHARRHYSVAQHSWHMSCLFGNPLLALQALLHDAQEAYLGDIIQPLKPYLHTPTFGPGAACLLPLGVAEDRVQQVIFQALKCPWPVPAAIKDADARMLVTEAFVLMGVPGWACKMQDAGIKPYRERGLLKDLDRMDPVKAEELFLGRYQHLIDYLKLCA